MQTVDVKVGQTYLTKVSERFSMTRVVVVSETTTYSGRPAFIVRKEDSDKPLPKPRTAAALYPTTFYRPWDGTGR